MPLSEHMYCVAIAFKMTQWVEWICIKFHIKLEHFSVGIIGMIQEAAAMGNWWLAVSSQQCARSCITSHADFFGETSNHSGDSAHLQTRFGAQPDMVFPKTKMTFEREEISECRWDSGKYNRAADGDWENYVRSQGAYFEGDGGVIVLCTMFLVSSSTNVSIFHITWLDTFWTDLVCTPVFIAALFIIVKIWKQPRCSSLGEWIKKLWYFYTMEYYLAIKKGNFIFCDSMDRPGEHYFKWNKPVRERQLPYDFTCMRNLMNKMN